MTEDDFFSKVSVLYPNVDFRVGPCGGKDDEGKNYKTLVIGGVKSEGNPFEFYITSPEKIEDETLYGLWWEFFRPYAVYCERIVVRKFPCISHWKSSEVTAFDNVPPCAVEVNNYQVMGRFSFYFKQEEEK